MNNNAWQTARKKAGPLQVRVHDLKHTFDRRVPTAGMPLETRNVLALGLSAALNAPIEKTTLGVFRM